MNFVPFIAWKHLTKRCHSGFISFNFGISVLGVAVGVMALIVVLSVMSGFDKELKTKIVGVQPHIILEQAGGIDDYGYVKKEIESLNSSEIISAAPFVQGQAIIRSETYASGVVVKGIDPAHESIKFIKDHTEHGEFNLGDITVSGKSWLGKEDLTTVGRVMIGEELARTLGVGVGDLITIISPALDERSVSSLLKRPKSVPFYVGGIFHVGMNDFDSSLVLVNLEQGQKLYRLGNRVTGIGMRIRDISKADQLKVEILQHFDSTYMVRSWMDLNRNFFSALRVEKAVMTILLSLIVLVAAFNIVSSLTMVVMQKTRDIGILRSVGASTGAISQIFLLEGFLIGFAGVILGSILGLLLSFNLNFVADIVEKLTGFSVFPKDIYFFDQIPVEVKFDDVGLIIAGAFIMSLVAGLYPAFQAARLKPVEALRLGS